MDKCVSVWGSIWKFGKDRPLRVVLACTLHWEVSQAVPKPTVSKLKSFRPRKSKQRLRGSMGDTSPCYANIGSRPTLWHQYKSSLSLCHMIITRCEMWYCYASCCLCCSYCTAGWVVVSVVLTGHQHTGVCTQLIPGSPYAAPVTTLVFVYSMHSTIALCISCACVDDNTGICIKTVNYIRLFTGCVCQCVHVRQVGA